MTSASTRNVAVSDQATAETETVRPGWVSPSVSILVNGQGPAMQEARALRNSFPAPASSETVPVAAFHFPSGEHGGVPLHGTLPVFSISNDRTALPTVIALAALIE